MRKKLLILSLSIAVLFVFSAPISSVIAGGKKSKKVNWRIAGTIVQLININVPIIPPPDPPVPPFFKSVGMHSLINLSAKGSPGPAKITLLSRAVPAGDVEGCPSDYQFSKLIFDKNDFVAIFPDQSLLFTTLGENDGEEFGLLCIGFTGTFFAVRQNVTGGTGRFEGASGVLEASGYGLLY
jgi:hypothetical protein